MPKPRYVRAVDSERRKKWLDVLGTDVLPIKDQEPAYYANLFDEGDEPQMSYVLDLGRLTNTQQHNLFAFFSKQTGYSIEAVSVSLLFYAGVALPVGGLELVEAEDEP
jgi:hypothetical protein